MSIECGECEHDLRGGHGDDCSRVASNLRVAADIARRRGKHDAREQAAADLLDEVWGWLEEGVGLLPLNSNLADAWIEIVARSKTLAYAYLSEDQ